MGLYGALVVRPAGHPDQVNDRADSAFNAGKEYVFLLSEVDPDVHLAVERSQPVDWTTYTPRYFMINGRSMPDTLAPNNASWLPEPAVRRAGPHQAVRRGDATRCRPPSAISTRARSNYPFHPHGSDERVINRDGHALQGPSGQDLSYNKYDIDVGPGQTVDVLMDWRDVEHWNAPPTRSRRRSRRSPTSCWSDRHLVQRERLPGHQERAAGDHHLQQRVRRVLPHRPQPRARASDQLRRSLRRNDDGLPHRPARRLHGEVRAGR